MSLPKKEFGDVFEISGRERAGNRDYPIMSITMAEGLVDQSDKFKKRVASKNTSTYKVVKNGELVVGFPIDEGVLGFQRKHERGIVSPAYDIWTIRDGIEADKNFLEYYLRSSHAIAIYKSKMRRTVNRRRVVPRDDFVQIELPFPSLEEQKRIAAILDKADAIRRKRQQALRLTDDFLRSVFLDLFGDPVTNPKGWEETTAGEELEFLTSGSRGWAKYYADEGDLFIRIQNLRGGILDLSDAAYVDAPDSAEAKRTRVQPGDVLLSITADLGRTAVVPDGIGKAHINQHLAILRFASLNPVFVSHLLATPGGQSQFQSLNRSAVKAGLNFDDIRSIRLLVPPPELQEKFASIVEKVIGFGGKLSDANELSLDAFHSLQQRAFRGEL